MLEPRCEVGIPEGAEILSVHEQEGNICMWVLLDPTAEKERRSFQVFGTGHVVPDIPMKFIGTVHMYRGELVWHVFELL